MTLRDLASLKIFLVSNSTLEVVLEEFWKSFQFNLGRVYTGATTSVSYHKNSSWIASK